MEEPSPELEAYFNLCVRIYERMVREGIWDDAVVRMVEERLVRKTTERVDE